MEVRERKGGKAHVTPPPSSTRVMRLQHFLPLLALQRPFSSLRNMSAYTQSDLPNVKLNDGVEVPIIGYGLGTANYGKDAKDGIVLAYKNGYSHWDGAEMYKNEGSEAAALKEIGVPRESIFITSKVGSADPRASLENSLKLLNTDYVDLYLIHSPELVQKTGLGEAWKVMEQLKAEGKARSIGVSNYRIKDLEETLAVAKVVPSANQVSWRAPSHSNLTLASDRVPPVRLRPRRVARQVLQRKGDQDRVLWASDAYHQEQGWPRRPCAGEDRQGAQRHRGIRAPAMGAADVRGYHRDDVEQGGAIAGNAQGVHGRLQAVGGGDQGDYRRVQGSPP